MSERPEIVESSSERDRAVGIARRYQDKIRERLQPDGRRHEYEDAEWLAEYVESAVLLSVDEWVSVVIALEDWVAMGGGKQTEMDRHVISAIAKLRAIPRDAGEDEC